MNREIVLTEQELEDLKDTIKFRERVILQLKQLGDIPDKVRKLEIWGIVFWFFISSSVIIIVVKVVSNGR